MPDLSLVTQYFALLSGVGEGELANWTPLCRACVHQMVSCLRPEVDLQDEETEERIALACAAQASYRYALIQFAAQGQASLSTEEFSVTVNSRFVEEARQVRDEMLALCSQLVQDDFSFTAI